MMIMSIAVSPTNPRDLAVIGRPTTGAAFQGNLYFSADGGANWQAGNALAGLSPSAYLFSLQAGTANGGEVYALFEDFRGVGERGNGGASESPYNGDASSHTPPPPLPHFTHTPHLFI